MGPQVQYKVQVVVQREIHETGLQIYARKLHSAVHFDNWARRVVQVQVKRKCINQSSTFKLQGYQSLKTLKNWEAFFHRFWEWMFHQIQIIWVLYTSTLTSLTWWSDLRCKRRANNILVRKLDDNAVFTWSCGQIANWTSTVFVVDAVNFGLGWALNGQSKSTFNTHRMRRQWVPNTGEFIPHSFRYFNVRQHEKQRSWDWWKINWQPPSKISFT